MVIYAYAPELPYRSLLRKRPDLAGKAVVFIEAGKVKAKSPGVPLPAGLDRKRARLYLPEVIFLDWNPDDYEDLDRQFLEACFSVTPRVESAGAGRAYLAMSDERDGEIDSLGRRLRKELGLSVHFVRARSRFVARLKAEEAAEGARQASYVRLDPLEERECFSGVPVASLPLPRKDRRLCLDLGFYLAGDLLAGAPERLARKAREILEVEKPVSAGYPLPGVSARGTEIHALAQRVREELLQAGKSAGRLILRDGGGGSVSRVFSPPLSPGDVPRAAAALYAKLSPGPEREVTLVADRLSRLFQGDLFDHSQPVRAFGEEIPGVFPGRILPVRRREEVMESGWGG